LPPFIFPPSNFDLQLASGRHPFAALSSTFWRPSGRPLIDYRVAKSGPCPEELHSLGQPRLNRFVDYFERVAADKSANPKVKLDTLEAFERLKLRVHVDL
jgi:hypothetical protein